MVAHAVPVFFHVKGEMESTLDTNNSNPFSPMVEAIADAVLRLRPAFDCLVRPRLFSVDQAAVYIGRTAKATRCLIDANAFPSVRTDGRIMLDVRDLDRWIDTGKVEAF